MLLLLLLLNKVCKVVVLVADSVRPRCLARVEEGQSLLVLLRLPGGLHGLLVDSEQLSLRLLQFDFLCSIVPRDREEDRLLEAERALCDEPMICSLLFNHRCLVPDLIDGLFGQTLRPAGHRIKHDVLVLLLIVGLR